MKEPKVSIVIVNYNGRDLTSGLLKSISKLNYKNYELIVVDNNSSDGSQKLIKKNFKGIILVENKKNLGYSGTNSAIKYCKGKYILFLNNDMGLDKNSLNELVKTVESHKGAIMVAPKLVNFYDKKLKSGGTWLSRSFYNGHFFGNNKIIEIPYMGVGLVRKDLILKLGHIFDPDYFIYGEDVDLGLSLRLMGCKVVFVPEAVIYHMHAMTTKSFEKGRTTFLMERNMLTTFFKILSMKNIIVFLPYAVFMRIIALIKDIVSLRLSNAFSRIKAILWIIFNFNSIYKKRRKLQKLRVIDDRFLLKVFSEKYLFRKKAIV